MEQLRKLIAALSLRQKVSIVLASVLVGGALFGFVRWKKEGDFKPLYTSLAPEDAAAVVQRLKETGVEYRINDSGNSVSVPSERVAELRLEMAGAGLARSGRIGFELFDKPNFGATDFTEHVNFRRALEGELERSVASIGEVESARVHLTFARESLFAESRQPAKASVMLKLRTGAQLSPSNVTAISHLLASAVEGLAPEAVSVLDMRGNLLSRPRKGGLNQEGDASEATLDYQQKIERDLLAKIESTLDPLLGPGKFRAGVSAECDFSSGEQSEETFDPTRSVMVTSQKTEDVGTSGGAGGLPGTASNLPNAPEAQQRTRGPVSGMQRRTENVAYQSSRVVKRLRLPQGAIKRLSVSVLVDHQLRWEGTGEQAKRNLTPPPPETMKVIRDLVSGVTGLNTNRGDQLIVEALPFESTLNSEPPPSTATPATQPQGVDQILLQLPPWVRQYVQNTQTLLIAAAAGAAVVLLLAGSALFFLLRRRQSKALSKTKRGKGRAGATVDGPRELSESEDLTHATEAAGRAQHLALETEKRLEAQLIEQSAIQHQKEAEALSALRMPSVAATKKTEVLSKHLRESIKAEPSEASRVLRTWLTEE
jgi:flagellar M-ring protein FliF